MASSSDDAATEALIAQLMAEDLGESYDMHTAPIGASYHDYEEPLSSYERQCLDAENNPDEAGEEGSGWGPEDSGGLSGTAVPDEGLRSTGTADEGTWDSNNVDWDSRFIDDEGVQHEAATTQQPQTSPDVNEDNERKDDRDLKSSHRDGLIFPTRITSLALPNAPPNPTGETPSLSAPATYSNDTHQSPGPGPARVPHDHLDAPSLITSPLCISPPTTIDACGSPPATQPPSNGEKVEDGWDDGLDYSYSKGKGKAVRAYDEFKRGLRNNRVNNRIGNDEDDEGDGDIEDEGLDSEEEGEIRDEDLPFIRIPWPSTETDELLSRREDTEVVEIHVGDDETLESILNDISLRDERRRKGKGVEGRVEGVGQGERDREEVLGRNDVAAWW